MELIEKTLQMVKKHLPPPGTELGCYTFLAPDALWTGTVESQHPFVVVAEDNWGVWDGLIMIVMADGPVHIAALNSSDVKNPDYHNTLDLEQDSLISYCAADFPKFMEIMKLYQATLETIPCCPDVFDDEGLEKCAEAERVLRQQIMKIDPTAIEDTESLWSTTIEEMGSGM